MRLILVRHGETPANLVGSLETSIPGPGLTDLGREQSEALVHSLAHEAIDAIVVSTMVRTRLTAEPLARARGLEPVVRAGVREIEAGDLEGRTDAEAVRRYIDVVNAWISGDLDARMPGGQDGHEVLARIDEVVAEAEKAHDAVAVVSHGGAIWAWTRCRANNLPPARAGHLHVVNTGIVVLEGSTESGWVVESWLGESLDPVVAEGAARDESPAAHLDD